MRADIRSHWLITLAWALVLSVGLGTVSHASKAPELRNGKHASRGAAKTKINPYASLSKRTRFPYPIELKPQVEFWKKVYSRYTTRQTIIHDSKNMDIIYEIVDFDRVFKGKKVSSRTERKYVKKRRKRVQAILERLYKKRGKATTSEEKAIAAKFSKIPGYKKFRNAKRRVRSQLGQADRFRRGLVRSGRYMKTMRRIFRSHGLPEELTALPHVESSFNYKAYSSVGAAGIWQFMRSTGRSFMKIGYTVDERRDPIVATDAAARLLKSNYKVLKSWPLAITAYNHGTNGMKRAKRKFGTDIARIIKHHRSRSFGFASKNFYAEFLAASEVSRNHKRYFGNVNFEPEFRYDEVVVRHYTPAKKLARAAGMSIKTMKRYNPALRKSVWRGNRLVPMGYKLRVPKGTGARAKANIYNIPSQFARQKSAGHHIVQRGDALSTIARMYRVSVPAIKEANGLTRNMIRAGQRLIIPGRAKTKASSRKVETAFKNLPAGDKYRVRRGDSLYKIAKRAGMTTRELAQRNGISVHNPIYPGQNLSLKDNVKKKPLQQVASISPVVPVPQPVQAKEKPATKEEAVVKELEVIEAKPVPLVAREQEPRILADGLAVTIDGRALRVKASDYAIKKFSGNIATIIVAEEETIGHFVEWAKVSTKRIKSVNRRGAIKRLRVGTSIKIPLTKARTENFERKRLEYHMSLLEDFFDVYKVDGEKEITVKRGKSMWELCVIENQTPIWLVMLYNPNVNLGRIAAGDIINLPVVVKK
ncbi:Membrane-bound lytic murein transglycosylase D [hydrothermal vent metagenome]|uniref:Membrane-bound lytic murein transglycosylase D n=1 Tax=hydrothermal vent metagenome TaxID=652676 RepID=A0A3B1C7M2_9ZZZZ